MSSFIFKAKCKSTGEAFDVCAMDDYFARRKYGYAVEGEPTTLTEDQFFAKYERVEP